MVNITYVLRNKDNLICGNWWSFDEEKLGGGIRFIEEITMNQYKWEGDGWGVVVVGMF